MVPFAAEVDCYQSVAYLPPKGINYLLLGCDKMIITILIFMFNILMLIFPQIVLTAARDGLLLWFNNVLPSLAPFIIATNMLMSLGFAKFLGKLLAPMMNRAFALPGVAGFALVTGLISGYPLGAKTVADLHKQGEITNDDAQHLLSFCNNAGPLFIVGVVGVGLFHSSFVGYLLWFTHVLAALVVGLMMARGKKFSRTASTRVSVLFNEFKSSPRPPIGKALGDAVKNAMDSLVFIGGLIIFFSVVVAIGDELLELDDSIYAAIFAGLAEVTGGVKRLSLLAPSYLTVGFTAFLIGFSGLSIHAQTLHFISETGIKTVPYIFAKFLHGVLAGIFAVVFAWILLY